MESWPTIAAMVTVVSVIGGFIYRLSGQISETSARSKAAVEIAKTAAAKAEQNERALVEHRVSVAREYVTTTTLASLENKVVEAINRLGDRLDSLFMNKTSRAHDGSDR